MTMDDLAAESVNSMLVLALSCLLQIDAGRGSLASLKTAFSLVIFSQFLTQCGATTFSSNCLTFMELIDMATKGYQIVKTLADPTTAMDGITSTQSWVNQPCYVKSYLTCIEQLSAAMIQHRQSIAQKDLTYAEACLLQKCRDSYNQIGINVLSLDESVKQNLDDILCQFDTLNKELNAIFMPTFVEPFFGW